LAAVTSPSTGLVPVHIGQPEPSSEQGHLSAAEHEQVRNVFRDQERLRVPGDLDWAKHGLQPRWLGMETSDCAITIEPGYFTGHGLDERRRFIAGAAQRGETALVVTSIGNADGDDPRRPTASFDASVRLADLYTSVGGRRLPAGARPTIAPDLNPADRDLAIRLLTRPQAAPWWTLHLHGMTTIRGDGFGGETQHPAQGQLEPILIDALGDPVVAAWVPSDGSQRWYVLPDGLAWDNVLGWLMHRALPQYAPDVLRRVRSPHFTDPDLQTNDEDAARNALAELEERYALEHERLEQELHEAEAKATPIRYGLLYGSGTELVDAVATVLKDAGLDVVDLDADLGATQSADLLVSAPSASRRLVEIKGSGGPAREDLVSYLVRHLQTWPELRPDLPVDGGVLVVNHQHKVHPTERTEHVYARPEFVETLPVQVLSSLQLFRWWRVQDWTAIRTAILGAGPTPVEVTGTTTVSSQRPAAAQAASISPEPARPAARTGRRAWWGGSRRG
jgi:hypothetical protein